MQEVPTQMRWKPRDKETRRKTFRAICVGEQSIEIEQPYNNITYSQIPILERPSTSPTNKINHQATPPPHKDRPSSTPKPFPMRHSLRRKSSSSSSSSSTSTSPILAHHPTTKPPSILRYTLILLKARPTSADIATLSAYAEPRNSTSALALSSTTPRKRNSSGA
ncbi:hypothetical protein BDU57DRAFT_528386 [Ampelomyces quisqualis]|uniref:Uncharacterized protein n=1 Tax=Ampelomyces quisqualis TaxID=50730 RepID=A0A6A5QR55_AMPQU|nr:hypothetical protein BDU57DRAFT_528386 [Ampelomyces quisqualis]